MAGWPCGRLAGWPAGRVAGWPAGRVAGGRLAGFACTAGWPVAGPWPGRGRGRAVAGPWPGWPVTKKSYCDIKERQRKRAVEHRLKTRTERAIANVARQEEAERRFNRPEFGRKDKVFPLAEGELARKRQAAPMHRRERAFIKDQDEEMPEDGSTTI